MSFRFNRRQGMGAYLQGHAALRLATTGNGPGVPATIAKIAGEVITAGQLVSLDDSAPSGTPNAWLAEADGGVHRQHAVGYALNSAIIGGIVNIIVAGQATVVDAYWDAVPAVGDVGALVFMSNTKGNSTMTATAFNPSVNQKVAVVSVGGAGASKAQVQIGDGVVLLEAATDVFSSAILFYNGSNLDGANNTIVVPGSALASAINLGTLGGAASTVLGVAPTVQSDPNGFDYMSSPFTGGLRQILGAAVPILAPTKAVCITRPTSEQFGGGQSIVSLGVGPPAPAGMSFQFDQTNAALVHKYFVNGGAAATADGGSALGRWDLLITETLDDIARTLYYSGVTTVPAAAQSASPFDSVLLLASYGTFGERAYYGGGVALFAFWVGTYPTNAQILASLSAMGFPAFPFV